MRRIYDSEALRRDDDPFTPADADEDATPQSARSIPSSWLSRLLVPTRLRTRAVSVDVRTPRAKFTLGESIPFEVTMKNGLPVPVTIDTESPVVWSWNVDGVQEASHVPLRDPPDEPGGIRFERGERKRFRRRWDQMFKVGESTWEPAEPGEYTIGAGLNVEDSVARGLHDATTVVIRPD